METSLGFDECLKKRNKVSVAAFLRTRKRPCITAQRWKMWRDRLSNRHVLNSNPCPTGQSTFSTLSRRCYARKRKSTAISSMMGEVAKT